jgi:hypothetical protein
MQKTRTEECNVRLIFDRNTLELEEVIPIDPNAAVDSNAKIQTDKKYPFLLNPLKCGTHQLEKLASKSYIYATGSPGCLCFRTTAGYIQICW